MALDRDEDVGIPFSQDTTAQIGYGANSDFVSKLIAKAQNGNETVVRTPPQSRIIGTRFTLRNARRSKDVESVLKALKLPMQEVESSGRITTRSMTLQTSGTSASNKSLNDSTDSLFDSIPPTPPPKRIVKASPKTDTQGQFKAIDSAMCSTPLTASRTRTISRLSIVDSPHLGLDRSIGGKSSLNQKIEEDSMDDLLIEATQQAEMQYAKSQKKDGGVLPKSDETPRSATHRIRRVLTPVRPPALIEPDIPKDPVRSQSRTRRTPRKVAQQPSQTLNSQQGSKQKCSLEEIQKKREAALKKRNAARQPLK